MTLQITRNGGPTSPALVALGISLALGVLSWTWRTGAVGGSDSACYALMARVFADGQMQPGSPLALDAPWPDASRVAAPAGFLPSETRLGASVPICAPGYALLLAPLVWLCGHDGVHLVPPLAAALLAWLAFVLGRRVHSPWAGASAAALVASNPIVLFQAVQPMNDITTGALWLAIAVTACASRPLATGGLVGVALLVRPNLVLAGGVAILVCAVLADGARTAGRAARVIRAVVMASSAALPGVLIALALNARLYGSPFQSGYGDLYELFAWSHVPVNLEHYGRTWVRTGTPLVLLAFAAPWVVARERRPLAWAIGGLAVALAVGYLAYRPFDEWWYLRFLMPAVALSLVMAAAVATAGLQRVAPRAWPISALLVVLLAARHGLQSTEAHEAFGLRALEARFPLTAQVVASRLDPAAVPITLWQSGGLRYWPGREVVVWDALDPAWLDRAIAWLQAHGRSPVILVERSEEEAFRLRFAGQTYGGLDWPPRYDVDRRVRIFVPEAREPYLRGERAPTETIFGERR